MIAIVRVHKADPVADQKIPTTTIQISEDGFLKMPIDFDSEARALRDALVGALPGGTMDRLIVLLLETRTGQLTARRP